MLPKRKHPDEITETRHVRADARGVDDGGITVLPAQLISGTYANK